MIRLALLLTLATLIATATPSADARRIARGDGVTIDRQIPNIDTKIFDPNHLPNPGPVIPPGLQATTDYNFFCHVDTGVEYTGDQPNSDGSVNASIRLNALKVKLTLQLTTWLPKHSPAKLAEHEAGHVQIDRAIYDQRAEMAATQIANSMIGQEFTSSGANVEQARQNAMDGLIQSFCQQYHSQTKDLVAVAGSHYDSLTDHGRNTVPTQEAVDSVLQQDLRF